MEDNTIHDFEIGDEVLYVPNHVQFASRANPECELGIVSEKNQFYIFVKFKEQLKKLGWDEAPAKACSPKKLVKV